MQRRFPRVTAGREWVGLRLVRNWRRGSGRPASETPGAGGNDLDFFRFTPAADVISEDTYRLQLSRSGNLEQVPLTYRRWDDAVFAKSLYELVRCAPAGAVAWYDDPKIEFQQVFDGFRDYRLAIFAR